MFVKLAGAALNLTPLAFQQNKATILDAIRAAQKDNVHILCLPELCITGYDCMDAFYSPDVMQRAWMILQEIIPHTQNIGVAIGVPLLYQQKRYNAVAWVTHGVLHGFACKETLANQEVYYESRWFTPWQGPPQPYAGVFIGQRVYDYQGIKIGFEICEEAWVEARSAHHAIQAGAQIILNPSASHFCLDKHLKRRALVQTLCDHYNVAYIFTNALGNGAGRLLYDGHILIGAPHILGEHLTYASDNYTLYSQTYDPQTHAFLSPPPSPLKNLSPYEQFTRIEALALWDTLRKTKTNGFVISLSGGVDSSVCATLVWMMKKLVKKQNIPLTLVYQKTHQNSPATQHAAEQLAKALDATYLCFDVQPLFEAYQAFMPHPLTWQTHDLALQNLQARVRSPSVWLIANVQNALLLATSNRSESAVGYVTMDGDTSGSFSPLTGIDKPFLQGWLAWAATEGLPEIGPLPALHPVLTLTPSAELRPNPQTDENDLMPYPVLNAIEGLLRKEHCWDKKRLLSYLIPQFSAYPAPQLATWIDLFFTLWQKNQWKRERFAPGFHIDTYSLDPKSDCRLPIFFENL